MIQAAVAGFFRVRPRSASGICGFRCRSRLTSADVAFVDPDSVRDIVFWARPVGSAIGSRLPPNYSNTVWRWGSSTRVIESMSMLVHSLRGRRRRRE